MDKTFDIKICNINWDGDEAKIIIIFEELYTQKMKHLGEQARCKNNHLATVSHDLRTTLNGVIRVLEMSLDSVQENIIRNIDFLLPKTPLFLFRSNIF